MEGGCGEGGIRKGMLNKIGGRKNKEKVKGFKKGYGTSGAGICNGSRRLINGIRNGIAMKRMISVAWVVKIGL